eukprot:jgi/Botrbrau1/10708/Bobra.357_1s0010.1
MVVVSALDAISNISGVPRLQRRVGLSACRPSRGCLCRVSRDIRATAERDKQLTEGALEVRKKNPSSRREGPLEDFLLKFRLAWAIFFPPKSQPLTPKDEGKHRLRMILVADRCGMNQTSLYEMKHSIVQVVQNYVDIEGEDLVEVNVTMDPDMGTIYSVAVPVKRVKPQARVALDGAVMEVDGISLEWEIEGDADASGRFPYGC